LGDAGAERYRKSLDIVVRDKKNNQILVLLTPQTSTEIKKTAEVVNKIAQKYPDKLILSSFIGGASVEEGEEILRKGDSIYYQYPGQAVSAMSKYIKYRKEIKTFKTYNYYEYKGKTNTKTENLDYLKALNILKKYNIPVLRTKRIENTSELSSLNYPIALKMVGPEIVHKTDDKALEINIKNKQEASTVLKRFKSKFKKGYAVSQPMAKDFLEIILGFKRDESFGPIIMVRLGGIYTEVFRDVQIGVDDIDEKRAKVMIKKLKSYPIIKGTRGEAPYDINALAKALVSLTRLARENLDIEEIDINPLFIKRKGIIAGDVRILKSKN
jgi:acetyltransferase